MKKIVFLLVLVAGFVSAQKRTQPISGTVTDGRVPLKNVKIELQESTKVAYTDAEGRYMLNAAPGNKITYSYVGFKSIEVRVEDVTRVLNIEMFPDITELDEVTVTRSNRKSKEDLEIEFSTNPNLIRSAYGILDATTSAYQIRVLEQNQITEVGLCILGVLRGQFPGVGVSGDCIQGGSVSVRGSSSINYNQAAIFDVDGLVLNDAPIWIPVGNIERVAVLSGLAARNLYGGIASGGVVIINTNAGIAYSQSKEMKDKARLRNNKYTGDALSSAALFNDQPVYLQELEQSTSFVEAKKRYEYYADKYGGSYSYAIDALTYFKARWNEDEFTDSIVEDTYKSFGSNPVAIKALAYVLQANGDFKKAYELNREVFIQRPNYAQSYMDLANSYRDLNQYKTAATLFTRYDYLVDQRFLRNDSTAFSTIMNREFNNLIAVNGNEIISKNAKKHVLEDDFNGTRLVFEWNDSEAEFELQFVNPEGQYFTSKHSLMDNANRIGDEKLLGFSCEEFLIDGSLPGNWQVNVRYLGNKSLTPSYVKVTTYYDYGTNKQRKSIDLFKLSLKNVNQELFKINSTSRQRL
jgi:tetratricopeptide (TPR) repeat protein